MLEIVSYPKPPARLLHHLREALVSTNASPPPRPPHAAFFPSDITLTALPLPRARGLGGVCDRGRAAACAARATMTSPPTPARTGAEPRCGAHACRAVPATTVRVRAAAPRFSSSPSIRPMTLRGKGRDVSV
jgi:hypothetical protein